MKRLAIFGAGPGMGLATARRFGKEGFEVALVSRNGARLESFVDILTSEGLRAKGIAADLADISGHADLVAGLGHVDVAVINGFLDMSAIRPALDIDVDTMRTALEGAVLAPLSLTRLLLPGMLDRGDGGLLYGFGASAKNPLPALAGAGTAQASLRNYAFNLNLALADKGIYVGALTIGALIRESDAEALFDADPAARRGFEPEMAEPADLADRLWRMYTERATPEETVGSLAA
ncbi:SDR family NAD(P)-dependent oxidoreductase [Amycolatopsis acidicola]|uniref:SDR family NAD(P)-dependent oxidoreductase n=1 Tax=Amycolatopsis acidicola TaxID=2596893 RepID=A0A5N0V119_9PSEU|nr:SDR family NAD(P)-dependent oxidoreductase [Amycolatopsis acidicola]KAA9157612.1 SDR family NAD(P)-dependent oxidoreductase [Amycolatopsis acidicola]